MVKNQYREMPKNQNVAIKAQPQFVSIFRKSVTVSKTKGNNIFYETTKSYSRKGIIEEIKYEYENRINKLND